MGTQSKSSKNRSLAWIAGTLAVFSLTGCSMYPSKPGVWPKGIWGSFLQFVSGIIDDIYHVVHSYGIAIIIITIFVRFLILPLMVRQIRMSKGMQELQPKVAAIREKYRGDNQKIQQETMKLWQEAGVNPMAGCLPMILQLPVLYSMFGAIEGNTHLNDATFLGIFQLGHPDHYYILPILAAVTTFLSQRVMMTGQDTQQKMMLIIFPFMILFMATRFASGLALYWIVGNIFTAVQTYFIRVRPAKAQNAAASAAGTAKANKPSKRGSSK